MRCIPRFRPALLLAFCVLTAAGCARWRNRGRQGAGPDDQLPPGTLLDTPLTPRQADGIPVTDHNLQPVHFAYDSFRVEDREVAKIEAAADYLRRNAGVRAVIEGHCDERGSREYNMALGENRALAVRVHLIRLGIDAGRVQTRSFGEERPVDPGHGEDAWQKNRRGEFALFR